MRQDGDKNHREHDAIRTMVEQYKPQGELRKYWPEVRDFVVATAIEYAPESFRTARSDLRHLTTYAVWLWHKAGLSLTPEVAFSDANIRRWARTALRDVTPNQRYISELTVVRYASAASGRPRRRVAVPTDRHRSQTYSRAALVRMISEVRSRPTPRGRRDGAALLALAAGGGLFVHEMLNLRIGDITTSNDTYWLHVRGDRPRVVPLRRAWVGTLALAIGDRNDATEYVAWENRERTEALHRGIAATTSHPPQPNAQILRQSWVAALYRDGVHLDRLMELGGYASADQVLRVVRRLGKRDTDEQLELVIGGDRL